MSALTHIDDLILKIVRSFDKALSAKEILDKLSVEIGKKFPRRTLNYRLEKLVSLKVLKPVLSDVKQVAYIPMERYKEWTEVKFQERKIHSDELKREVIMPWIDQLPMFSGAVIHLPSSLSMINEYTGEENLDVENHDLFGDLESHLEPDIFERWKSFRCKVMEYTERRNQILSEIDERLEKETGLKVSDQWLNGVLYDRRVTRFVFEELFEPDTIAGDDLNEDMKINSQVNQDGDSLVYSIDGNTHIKVKGGEEDDEIFRARIGNILVNLAEEFKGSEHRQEISKLFELCKGIETMRDLIKIQLVRYLRKPVFRGDCEYLE